MTGPMRSTTRDDSMRIKVPWTDVIVDVQGPCTTAEGGERYVSSCLVRRSVCLNSKPSRRSGQHAFLGLSCPVSSGGELYQTWSVRTGAQKCRVQ